MKIVINILLGQLMLASLAARTQHSERKEFCLSEHVVAYETTTYRLADSSEISKPIADTSDWISKTYRHFDSRGMVDHYASVYHYKPSEYLAKKTLKSSIHAIYDADTIKIGFYQRTIQLEDSSEVSDDTQKTTITWHSPTSYTETTSDSATGEIRWTEEFILDTLYRIVSSKSWSHIGDTSSLSYSTVQQINSITGQVHRSETNYHDNEEASRDEYIYLEWDSYGNPLKILIVQYHHDRIEYALRIRQYTYTI